MGRDNEGLWGWELWSGWGWASAGGCPDTLGLQPGFSVVPYGGTGDWWGGRLWYGRRKRDKKTMGTYSAHRKSWEFCKNAENLVS